MNAHARFPDFFILGAAKSGTTSLHAWLSRHSEIAMSDPKEPFFFEAEYELGLPFYWRRYFDHWSGQRIVGEARHRNLYLPYVPKRILASAPDALFVVILRNPISRALSHWWHWFARGRENSYFESALEQDLERIEKAQEISSVDEIADYAAHLGADGRGPNRTYLDTGYYAIQLKRYFELFPRDRFKILFLEEVKQDPKKYCIELLRFLGANPEEAEHFDYRADNLAYNIDPRAAARWTTARARSLIKGTAQPAGPPIVARAPQMSEKTKAWLESHYASHNAALAELLGRRLPWD